MAGMDLDVASEFHAFGRTRGAYPPRAEKVAQRYTLLERAKAPTFNSSFIHHDLEHSRADSEGILDVSPFLLIST